MFITRTGWELIETLWNVNAEKRIICTGNKTELIETLWNVNKCARKIEVYEEEN